MTSKITGISKILILLRALLLMLQDAFEHPFTQFMVLSGLFVWLPPSYWPMIAALIGLTVAHEFGHWFVALHLGFEMKTFSLGLPFSKRRFKLGEFFLTEFQITPYWLFGGFVSFDPTDPTVLRAAIWKRALVLLSGIFANLIVAVLALSYSYGLTGKDIYHAEVPVLAQLNAGAGLARDAGMMPGDLIKSLNGSMIASSQQFIDELSARSSEEIEINVDRNGELKQFVIKAPLGEKLGVSLGKTEFVPATFNESLRAGIKQTGSLIWQMGNGLLVLFHIQSAPFASVNGADGLHSIVAFVQVGANAYTHGMPEFLYQVGVLSVMLAVFNLLPIPLLDGGHLLFLCVEKLRGKPVSAHTQNRLCMFFLYVFIGLALLGFYNDYAHPIVLS